LDKKIQILSIFSIIALGGLGVPAFAEVLTFEFSGVVTDVDDVSDFLGGSVGVGTTWSATVQIESDAIDRSQPVGDARGEYRANSITVQIGGLQFENFSPSDDAEVLVVVTRVTQFSPNSGFIVVADQITKTAGPDLPDGEDLDFTIALTSPANIDVFPDDSLPLPASLDLDDFELKGMSLFAFSGGAFPQLVLIIGTTTSLGETCPATVNQGQGLGNSFFDLIEPSQDTDPCQSADLLIVKIDSSDPVFAGAELTYTITVQNFGPDTAENVIARETLPAGIVGSAITNGCLEDPNGVPNCTLGNIASGGVEQYTVRVLVDPLAFNNLLNQVSVDSDTFDPDLSDNSDSESTFLEEPCPEVEITSHGNSATLPADTPILFTAEGSDPVAGDISESIRWSLLAPVLEDSIVDIGTGSSIFFSFPELLIGEFVQIGASFTNESLCASFDGTFVSLIESSLGQIIDVPPGDDVSVEFAAIDENGINSINVLFEHVDDDGTISFGFTDFPPEPPESFEVNGQVFDLSSTVPGDFTITVNYDDSSLTLIQELEQHIFHFDENTGEWQDITVEVMIGPNNIIGITDFNSPFGLFLPASLTVGGTDLTVDTAALLLAGAQSTSWMIPIVLSAVGIGLILVRRK